MIAIAIPATTTTTMIACIQIQLGLIARKRYSAALKTATTVIARIFASSGSDQCSM